MLTSWKCARTSIECGVGAPATKKKRSRKSTAPDQAPISFNELVGAHFVPPAGTENSHKNEASSGTSSGKKKKRRKAKDGAPAADGASTDMDIEPRLCLTSSHRVVFVGNEKTGSAAVGIDDGDEEWIESQSRNYVARPGQSTRFALGGLSAMRGVVSAGAQYDPSSNLVYALRNGGREVAVWTAAPCSTLRGPDDDAVDGDAMPINGRKRKSYPPGSAKGSSNGIVSCKLPLPEGKSAVTLSPFAVSSSPTKGTKEVTAVGAAGCCTDGSLWVAFRFHADETWGDFQCVVVEGSSLADENSNGAKKKRASSRKGKNGAVDDKQGTSGAILDSCVARISASCEGDNESATLIVQSVVLPEESRDVSVRNHRVIVSNNASTSARVERYTSQCILQLEASQDRSDVGVRLDSDAKSLSIVHRKKGGADDGKWTIASADLSSSDGTWMGALSTFPLPMDQLSNTATGSVLSFGRISQNIAAVLMKDASELTLIIIDIHRKVGLSSLSWVDGDGDATDTGSIAKDSVLNEMLQGKMCHGMVTNELGSIALLLTSSEQNGGSPCLDIVTSKLDAGRAALDLGDAPTVQSTNTGTSLASALRFVATSAPHPRAEQPPSPEDGKPNESCLAGILSSGADDNPKVSPRSAVDSAVDEACMLLTTSSKQILSELKSEDAAEKTPTMNGKGRKGGSNRRKKENTSLTSWSDAYRDGMALIAEAQGRKKLDHNKSLINGIRPDAIGALAPTESLEAIKMPERFVAVAFRETAYILLSLHSKGEKSTISQDEIQKATQEATSILVEVLQTGLISGREDYGIKGLHRGNVLLTLLKASASCPSLPDNRTNEVAAGKLAVLDAMLDHVQDIPEAVLVSILRFLLRRMRIDDVVAYYSTHSTDAKCAKGARLSERYQGMTEDDQKERVGAQLLTEAVLDFTSKVMTYSNCNQTFLTKAMRDDITDGEVEALLLTLAKLLKSGNTHPRDASSNDSSNATRVGITSGTIQWISALTDAHMGTILKLSDEGGLVIDRLQSAVRSAMAQSDFAKELQEISNHIAPSGASSGVATKALTTTTPSDTSMMPYSMERLAF